MSTDGEVCCPKMFASFQRSKSVGTTSSQLNILSVKVSRWNITGILGPFSSENFHCVFVCLANHNGVLFKWAMIG